MPSALSSYVTMLLLPVGAHGGDCGERGERGVRGVRGEDDSSNIPCVIIEL